MTSGATAKGMLKTMIDPCMTKKSEGQTGILHLLFENVICSEGQSVSEVEFIHPLS